MTERSILVTGASGVLGWHLCRSLEDAEGWTATGTFHQNRPQFRGVPVRELDLLDSDACASVLSEVAPDAVIHGAAMTAADECEQDRERAYAVNVSATRQLLDLTPAETWFVYVSTDLVFDGEKGQYTEGDETNPVNYYGETKVLAEELVRGWPRSVVVRVAKLFSHGSPFHACFTNWMREKLVAGLPLRLFKDQYRTPISVHDVSRGLLRLLGQPPRFNLYHLGGPERISRYEFGLLYAELFGLMADAIVPVRMAEVGLVQRGRDCSLDSSRFGDEFDFEPLPLRDGLGELKELESE